MGRELLIYVDGFMKSKQHYEPGCSVRVYSCSTSDGNSPRSEIEHMKYFVSMEKNKIIRGLLSEYPNTNNVSEYYAMWKGIVMVKRLLEEDSFSRVLIYSDSQLIVNQLNGIFHVNGNSAIKRWFDNCYDALSREKKIRVCWVSRKTTSSLLGH